MGKLLKFENTDHELLNQPAESSTFTANLETAILEYAINTFPYCEAIEYLPGYEETDFRDTLIDMINQRAIKIGFYYEEMQGNLILFYFLHLGQDNHIVLGLNPKRVRIVISQDMGGIFCLNEEQYIELLQIPLI